MNKEVSENLLFASIWLAIVVFLIFCLVLFNLSIEYRKLWFIEQSTYMDFKDLCIKNKWKFIDMCISYDYINQGCSNCYFDNQKFTTQEAIYDYLYIN